MNKKFEEVKKSISQLQETTTTGFNEISNHIQFSTKQDQTNSTHQNFQTKVENIQTKIDDTQEEIKTLKENQEIYIEKFKRLENALASWNRFDKLVNHRTDLISPSESNH